MKIILSILAAIILIFFLYHSFIFSPQNKIKKALITEYEECVSSNTVVYEIEWLRQCDNQKSLSKDCKKILTDGYPWSMRNRSKRYLDGIEDEYYKNGFLEFSKFEKKLSECSCETLPAIAANVVSDKLENRNADCLKKLDVKSKVLL